VAHPLYLFKDAHSPNVELFAPEKRRRWPALLFTNRQLNAEASAILYGSNHFTLVDTTSNQVNLLQAFLDGIGPGNAAHLSHLTINFPAAESQEERVVLREADLRGLKLLQEKCTGLATLETHVQPGNSKGLTVTSLAEEGSQFAREALAQVDGQFNAIPSLHKVIVRFYSGSPAPEVAELMQGYGWAILPGR